MTDLEKRAEEYVKIADEYDEAVDHIASFDDPPYDDLATGHTTAVKKAYLAGYRACQEDNQPRRIDPGDENTHPQDMLVVMLYWEDQWWYGRRGNREYVCYYGEGVLHCNPTHWCKLPSVDK